jgi:hypothetical protein
MMCRACCLAAIVIAVLNAGPITDVLAARPGGGQGFGGGSSESGGSGDDGSDSDGDGGAGILLLIELIRLAARLTWRYPAVMWPIWGVVAVGLLLRQRSQSQLVDPNWTWESFRHSAIDKTAGRTPSRPRAVLERLRDLDPDFSLVLFEDFVQALYARAHEARGRQRIDDLGAYLSGDARRSLSSLASTLTAVEGIVVGAIRYEHVRGLHDEALPDSPIVVEMEIEANYTERTGTGDAPAAYWVTERWTLRRSRSARSRPPLRVRSFGCPGCGAPLRARDTGVCAHCGIAIDPSEFDWIVERVRSVERRPTPPALTGTVAEAGTDFETIVDPQAAVRLEELATRDAGFTWATFEARVRHIFGELQIAWTDRDLRRARPYLSDQLAATWRYWFDAYQRAGLRNVSDGARVTALTLARVVSDRHYDALTVRLFATGLDYTVDGANQIRTGSRDTPRSYTEYWTLIRGRSTAGPARATATCPRCGAPLAVTMAGHCEHCEAHITAGEFDWVLSRVEQDESYQG